MLAQKAEVFSRELYFRECWCDCIDLLGNRTVNASAFASSLSERV